MLTFLAFLTACESDDMPLQHADSHDYITFSVSTEKTTTRSDRYEDYSPDKHPTNMGVFGYHDMKADAPIFNNETVTYNTASKEWVPTEKKKWDKYPGSQYFDFFAYMPQVADAKVEKEGTSEESTASSSNSYTLSFPFTMKDAPVIFDVKSAPIICTQPVHKEGTDAEGKEYTFERIVKLWFDQTLTGYRLLFQLDQQMGAIRQFRLKKVTLSGNLATQCTIARTFTYSTSDKSWTAGDIQWNDIVRSSFDATPFEIPYHADNTQTSTAEGTENTILLDNSNADYKQWGETLYTIPDKDFIPTISVTYDVEFVDEDGKTLRTRKDITSTITLNNNSFKGLVTTKTATINPIHILIQPRYLYVLSDKDAYTGYLLVE